MNFSEIDFKSIAVPKITYPFQYPKEEWVDKGNFYLNLSPQGSPEWLLARKFRLTASNVGAAIGHSNFKTPEEILLDITGVKPTVFSDKAIEIMGHGTKFEPAARKFYEEHYGVVVEELGLAIPKWNDHLGASLDGSILNEDGTSSDGMIEIKCPKTMYGPLQQRMDMQEKGYPDPKNFNHIWKTHYDQMQTCMLVCEKKWSEYVVYATESNQVYMEKIPLNEKYCQNILIPGIRGFIDGQLKPLIAEIIKNREL